MRQPLVAAAAIAALVCAAVLGMRALGGLERFDLAVYDAYLRDQTPLRGSEPAVAILELTDADLLELGRWPVTDAVLADALGQLSEAGARVVGVDLYREIDFPPGSAALEARFRSDTRIIGVRRSASEFAPGIAPPKGLVGTDRFGFAEMLPDPDGILRRGLLFQGDGEYSFGLRLALTYLAAEGIHPANAPGSPGLVQIGPANLPRLGPDDGGYVGADAGGYQILLDFRRPAAQLDAFSLSELRRGEVASERIRDRIVIVGVTAEGVHDVFDVPVVSSLHAGRGMPGVEVQAHVTDQLVRLGRGDSRPVRVLGNAAEAATVLLLALVGAAVGLAVRRVWGFALLVLASVLTVWLAGLALFRLGLWIPVAAPGLAAVGAAGLVTAWVSGQQRTQRALLMQLFSRHVSHEIASEIWTRRDEFLAGGRPRSQRLRATVLFLDLRGSTGPMEKLDPQQLLDWINHFMEALSGEIAAHGGIVDDYFGDGIKANFGVPLPRRDGEEVARDARQAVAAALAVRAALPRLNAEYRDSGLPTVAVRIGIDTGTVVAGSLGSQDRLKYTTVGDPVVTAARLESTEDVAHDFEQSPCRILISDRTLRHLGDRFTTEPLGELHLKGKTQPVPAHRVLGARG